MPSLRVGLFTEVYRPVRNGVTASVEALAGELRRRGHTALVVTPRLPGGELAREEGVLLPSLRLPTRTGYRLVLPFIPRERAAELRGLSLVHAHSPFLTGGLALRAARRSRIPLVFTYHTQLERYAHYMPFEQRSARYALRCLTRAYANAADVVIVPTAAMEAHLREIGVRSRIAIAPSGIDTAFFQAGKRRAETRARLGANAQEMLVLWVGRLGREKNLSLALDAFARLPNDARMAVVGEGKDRAFLEAQAERVGPGRVRFMGEQAREALPEIYASADVFLFTSTSETQGLVLTEALAAGIPIAAVNAPQSREMLGPYAHFCEETPDAAARAVHAAFAEGSREREARSAAARKYDTCAAAERVMDVYRAVLS